MEVMKSCAYRRKGIWKFREQLVQSCSQWKETGAPLMQDVWAQWRVIVVVVQLLNHVWLFVTLWILTHQAPLSFSISWSLLKLMSIESVMSSHHLILCCPFSSCPQSFPASGSFPMSQLFRWPKYWNFSFSIIPSSEYSGLISFRIDWFDLLAVLYRVNV